MKKRIMLMYAFIFVFFCSISSAAVIALKSGEIIKGKIVEETDDYVKVDSGIGVNITYYFEDIEGILDDESRLDIKDSDKDKQIKIEKYKSPEEKQLNEMMAESGVNTSPADIKNKIKKGSDIIENNVKEKIDIANDTAMAVKKSTSNIFKRIQASMPRNTFYYNIKSYYNSRDESFFNIFKLIGVALYFLYCFPLMMLSKKLGCNMVIPWIPILNVFYLVNMTKRDFGWYILLIVPIFNIFALFYVFIRISELLQKPKFLGFFSVWPIIGLPFLWYLALSQSK